MLAHCIIANFNRLPEILKDAFDLDELKSEGPTCIEQYFQETNNWNLLNTASGGAYEFKDNIFTINVPENEPINCIGLFRPINDFSNWVSRSYDYQQYPWEKHAWDYGYCSGDCAVALLEFYLIINKKTHKEFTTYNK